MTSFVPVPGFESLYEVNEMGEIMTVSTSFRNVKPGSILKPTSCKNGYKIVRLWKQSKSHAFYVHRIVMMAFVGPCPVGYEVNHIDGDRSNNQLSNLEYVTRSENNYHAYGILGRRAAPSYGENHGGAKLTWKLVDKMREDYKSIGSYAELARKYSVDWTTVKSIILHRTWKEEFRYENVS